MLFDELIKIRGKNKIPFHMPGSKGGAAISEEYKQNIFSLDFTELEDTDNLAKPEGILKDAQEKAAKIYGAAASYFLVNGSSGGILAALHYLSRKNKKIIFDRNCHVSVMNAIKLFDIKPIFVLPEFLNDWGIFAEILPEKIEKLILENPDTGAVFLTSPNYYGISSDLEKIYEICRRYDVLLCIDAAHGAHYNFSSHFTSAAGFCDISVMSIHKTMPAPTQTAIMNISEKIDFSEMKQSINIFQTTSPSYIFMAYIDYAINFMHKNGEAIFENLYGEISALEKALGDNMLSLENKDFSRIVIRGGTGLEKYLYENYDIAVEMSDINNIVCIAGAGNIKEDFEKLLYGVAEYYEKIGIPEKSVKIPYCKLPEFLAETGDKKIMVKLSRAEGLVAAEAITPYPPGVPIAIAGEVITGEMTEVIKNLISEGINVIGICDKEFLCVFDKKYKQG